MGTRNFESFGFGSVLRPDGRPSLGRCGVATTGSAATHQVQQVHLVARDSGDTRPVSDQMEQPPVPALADLSPRVLYGVPDGRVQGHGRRPELRTKLLRLLLVGKGDHLEMSATHHVVDYGPVERVAVN